MTAIALRPILAAFTILVASDAVAQTWDATTYLQPGGPSSCPKVSATYGFTLSGQELAVKIPAGQTHRAAIGPDGNVSLVYDAASSRVGRVSITGSTRTRLLSLTASAFQGCIYALSESVPTEPQTAYSGMVGDWALGRWNGLEVRNVQGVGLQSSALGLIVEKQRNGKVFCRFGEPDVVFVALWAAQCAITADSVRVVSGDADMNLQRIGEGRLEGATRYSWGSATIRFAR